MYPTFGSFKLKICALVLLFCLFHIHNLGFMFLILVLVILFLFKFFLVNIFHFLKEEEKMLMSVVRLTMAILCMG